MSKIYTIKELAEMLKPGQMGMQYTNSMLLFRPHDQHDPRVKALVTDSAWSKIGITGALKAVPTLENYYAVSLSGLPFVPTQKVVTWFKSCAPSLLPIDEWEPTQLSPLFDYQKEAVRFLKGRRRAMLSLSPGLGKTLTSAHAAGLEGFCNVLTVCPASLLFYWKGELQKWADKLPRRPQVRIYHRNVLHNFIDEPVQPNDSLWTITNPETVVKNFEALAFADPPFECLIADESIMYKHRESKRSQAIRDLADHVQTVWLLTGAPATRYLDDMWHQFHILKPKGYASYWRFARNYCIIEDTEWGSKVVANRPDAEEKIKKNFSDIYFSRTQDDVADIPDWIMEDVDIPMLPKQDKAYETLRKELYVRLESVDPDEVVTVNNHLSLMIRSVQVASNPLLLGGVDSAGKWDALPELMQIFPGPYLIWVNFIPTGEILRERFSRGDYGKLRVSLANGSTPMQDRNQMVDAFQNGEIDVLILNNQVGKFGFTLTKARTAFFVERMYDDSYFQCLHRNRRIGTEHNPIIVNMRSVTQAGTQTIDHLIHSTLDYRVGMIKKITTADLKGAFA